MVRKTEPFGTPSVSSAKYGKCIVVAEHLDQVFDMRGLSGTAGAQVTDVDGRYLEADTVNTAVTVMTSVLFFILFFSVKITLYFSMRL